MFKKYTVFLVCLGMVLSFAPELYADELKYGFAERNYRALITAPARMKVIDSGTLQLSDNDSALNRAEKVDFGDTAHQVRFITDSLNITYSSDGDTATSGDLLFDSAMNVPFVDNHLLGTSVGFRSDESGTTTIHYEARQYRGGE